VSCNTPQTNSCIGIPNAYKFVVPSRSNKPGIIRKLAAGKSFGMSGEFLDVLASVDIPQLHFEISTAADNCVSPHLHSVDRARMTPKLFQHCASVSIPNADGDILRAGNNIAFVKGKVKYCRCVMLEFPNWLIVVLDVVDNASAVRGPSDQDFFIPSSPVMIFGLLTTSGGPMTKLHV
jgi:hypothetical protein